MSNERYTKANEFRNAAKRPTIWQDISIAIRVINGERDCDIGASLGLSHSADISFKAWRVIAMASKWHGQEMPQKFKPFVRLNPDLYLDAIARLSLELMAIKQVQDGRKKEESKTAVVSRVELEELRKDSARLKWILGTRGVEVISYKKSHGFDWDGDNYSTNSVVKIDIAMARNETSQEA